ncbi:hypothetical protein [Streptomyces sp. NPDC007088]|uniref:lytic transglycosylase domain-containing protein n=1 Tax=Streptomyces sp. NPDC007088 TaxID=3364773 RepID=UPI00368C545A
MAAQFGIRLRKGAAATAIAALVMAALTASQAPGFTDDHRQPRSSEASDRKDVTPPTDDRYYTDVPPVRPGKPGSSHDLLGERPGTGSGTQEPVAREPAEAGIPATVLDAYKKAEAELAETRSGCRLPWQLLAAIGRVESGHASGGKVTAEGTTISRITGPQLNGNGFALISDTDGGRYDGDRTHDRAVGPMQFIPSTWDTWSRDGNGDGTSDPNNVYDAALAAGYYLCADGRDLATTTGRDAAVLSYNHSQEYLDTVLKWFEFYRKGTHEVPDGTGTVPRHPNRPDTPVPASSTPPSVRPSPTPPAHGTSASPHPSRPDKPGGSQSPDKPTKPTKPAKPSTPPATTPPTTPPATPPTTPTRPPAPPKPPAQRVARFADSATGTLTAVAGSDFAHRVGVRALDGLGKGVPGARVTFTVLGDTGATFAQGATSATVTTTATGSATAPVLSAGEKTGEFTVRAQLNGSGLAPVTYRATVTARLADQLARTDDKAFTAAPGTAFATRLTAKATLGKAAAPGVAATATVLKTAKDTEAADAGPYFKGADDTPARTVSLTTDEDGLLTLPELFADTEKGEYVLRVTTEGGAVLDVTLTVG